MDAIGEVLSSSIIGLVGESWHRQDEDGMPITFRPGFGSFLKIASTEAGLDIFAVVFNVITAPPDSLHKPTALMLTREQLKLEQPHIFALLRTEIHAASIGYCLNGKFFQRLPPEPAQVHDFIYLASREETEQITANLDFLRLVAQVSSVPTDELIAATVRNAAASRRDQYSFLVQAGQSLAHLFRDDYDRLLSVLRRIKPEPEPAKKP